MSSISQLNKTGGYWPKKIHPFRKSSPDAELQSYAMNEAYAILSKSVKDFLKENGSGKTEFWAVLRQVLFDLVLEDALSMKDPREAWGSEAISMEDYVN